MRRAAPLLARLAAPAAAQDLALVRCPTGGIGCVALPEGGAFRAGCERGRGDAGPPALPRPAGCDLGRGARFGAAPSGGDGTGCHGDTIRDPAASVLPCGASLRFGAVACTSRGTGMERRHADGGGFLPPRRAQVPL